MLLMSAMGGVLFIVGTYVFLAGLPGLITINVRVGAWMFIIGSLFFMIPGMYLAKVYFCSKKREVTLLDSR